LTKVAETTGAAGRAGWARTNVNSRTSPSFSTIASRVRGDNLANARIQRQRLRERVGWNIGSVDGDRKQALSMSGDLQNELRDPPPDGILERGRGLPRLGRARRLFRSQREAGHGREHFARFDQHSEHRVRLPQLEGGHGVGCQRVGRLEFCERAHGVSAVALVDRLNEYLARPFDIPRGLGLRVYATRNRHDEERDGDNPAFVPRPFRVQGGSLFQPWH
jgi:hypothetical protein